MCFFLENLYRGALSPKNDHYRIRSALIPYLAYYCPNTLEMEAPAPNSIRILLVGNGN